MFYRRVLWFVLALAALVAIINLSAAAQSVAQSPVFETASVKRNTSNEPFVGIGVQPGGGDQTVNLRGCSGTARPQTEVHEGSG